jgi:TP901 family phage tail tape measure protein
MADRTTKVTLVAQVAGYITGMEQAAKKTRDAAKATEDASAAYERQNQAMSTVGVGLVAVGAAALAATGLAVKAAIDWEQAWAGVTKTVDGTPEQMAELEDSLRSLARELPASHKEIAAVAEAAGQLGVKRADIAEFTRTMINLGETTNLSADEAATAIAQLMNVMGTAPENVDNLGAALVALGNDGASTEAEIIQMAQRLAGVGKLIGASEADILAMANAMASVGVSAELGGGAMSRVLQDIYAALADGGDKATAFAAVAGMSAQDFSKAFKSDPIQAMNSFILGLNDVESSGGNVIGTLSDLGIKSTEEVSTLLRLKGASDLLANSLDLGAKAWDENTALAQEAEKRYATVGSQIEIAKNNVVDAAIGFGEVFLPAVSAAATAVGAISSGFAAMPEPVKAVIAVTVALAGVVALAGGAFLLAVPKIAEYSVALSVLATSKIPAVAAAAGAMQRATAASMAGMSKAATFLTGPWGIALAGATIGIKLLSDYLDSLKASTEDYQNAIRVTPSAKELFEVADQGRVISQLDQATESAESFQTALNKISTSPWETGWDLSAQQLKKSLEDIGGELAKTAASDLPAAQAAFSRLASDMELSDAQMLQLLDSMPAYKEALKAQATELGMTTSNQNLLKLAQQETKKETKSASDAYIEEADAAASLGDELSQLIDKFNELNGINQDAVSSNASYQEALAGIADEVRRQKEEYEEANKSLDGYSQSLDENTVSGSANASMLSDVAAKAQDAALAQFEVDKTTMSAKDAADKYAGTLAEQRKKFEESAVAAGFSADQVKTLADRVFAMPSAKELKILASTAEAQADLDSFITRNDGRRITLRQQLITEAIQTGAAPGAAKAAYNANGSIMEFYANGGTRENHVAQIASADTMRVWAEPETEGEAYIPFAVSKRDRSLAIWAETGRRLGVQNFADGSPVYSSSSGGPGFAPAVTVGDFYVQNPFTGEYLKATMADIADSKVKQSGVQRRTTLENGVRR